LDLETGILSATGWRQAPSQTIQSISLGSVKVQIG